MPSGENVPLNDNDLDREITRILNDVFNGCLFDPGRISNPGPVLILPPDITRIHSRSGFLTGIICRELLEAAGSYAASAGRCPASAGRYAASPLQVLERPKNWSLGAIMPALGTHHPMSPEEITRMFPDCPADMFIPHRWRTDTVELGRLPAEWVKSAFSGAINESRPGQMNRPGQIDWPVQVNRILRDGLPSLIISIGQVVPHEVAGMANHAKNIFIGTGGEEAIHKSHWLGALYGLELLMGKAENPVRSLFDEALNRYGHLLPPILWILTVVDYNNCIQGLFCGFGRECFEKAAALAEKVNIKQVTEPGGSSRGIGKAVVWLDPDEYRSTWLGNKAIYRTRRALVPGGELLILAPGLTSFGEDPGLDALIRHYGYRGTKKIRQAVEAGGGLSANLGAAAHLIHGSGEGRFTIRYCTTPSLLDKNDIEGVGYEWGSLEQAAARYVPSGPDNQQPGWNTTADGELYYFIRNPALGLWTS